MAFVRLALIAITLLGSAATVRAMSVAPGSLAGVASPDGRIHVEVSLIEGQPGYTVSVDNKTVLNRSRLGVVRDDADFTTGLATTPNYAKRAARLEKIDDRYELPTSKRRQSHYRANRRVVELKAANGARMDIEVQVSNDGFAFRYVFPETDGKVHKISREASSFNFLPGTRGWLQPVAPARSGWNEANPSYEEYYERDIPVGQPSMQGGGWIFPALFRSGDTWLLVSESGLRRNYCGSRLLAARRSTEYVIDFPGPLETSNGGAVTPESTLPWITPWRLVVLGNLKTIAESTLGTDLADPPAKGFKTTAAGPGRASWSWPLLGDDNTVVKVQKRFIDFAAEMGWEYTLVDALWDRQIGYDGLKELIEYARPKNVKILVWYNSAGEWNTVPHTPRDRMFDPATRRAELQKIKDLGVAGVKVDFFAGDAQSTIAYYHDILEDTARIGLSANFHGATLPRGWQRTYPNLMTVEAVRGLEYNTFEQRNAEESPTHDAMLPFARNVFDPMDFTPVALERLGTLIERRTSAAFELATSVLFTSGIQHFAEIPQGMAKAPIYVRDFLKKVPVVWDDVRFIDGFPGEYVVIARRAGKTWYVAGINADRQPRKVKIDLKALGVAKQGTLITDGLDFLGFKSEYFPLEKGVTADEITMRPRGGFVLTFD